MKVLLSTEQLSEILQVPKATLYQWRHKNYGPPAIRVGRHTRYAPDALEKWLNEQSENSRENA